MLRCGENLGHSALLHQQTALHHRHPVGKAAHQVQIVRDQQHRHAVLALQVGQQIEYLPAQAHIQRGGRFVGQQQFGLARQRHGDHGALTLPAAELVRVSASTARRLGNAGGRQQLHAGGMGLARRQAFFELQHLGNLVAHGVERVERRHGLLENDGHLVTAHAAQLVFGHLQQVTALQQG